MGDVFTQGDLPIWHWMQTVTQTELIYGYMGIIFGYMGTLLYFWVYHSFLPPFLLGGPSASSPNKFRVIHITLTW